MSSYKTIHQITPYKSLARCGMEELAAHQLHAKPSGGIAFARNIDGPEKRVARELILDLFTPEKWPRPLNMMTMPGVEWRFERLLLVRRQPRWTHQRKPHGTHFTGIENDRAIFFAAATQMPGIETPDALVWPVNKERFPFAEHAIKTRFATLAFANVDDALAHDWTPTPYRDIPPGWDAAWLDYTGPLTVERLRLIKRFYEKYIRSTLIVTALKARWPAVTAEAIARAGDHSAWLKKNLHGEVLHDIDYFDSSPIAQFAVRH
jgi:hypothetical protein